MAERKKRYYDRRNGIAPENQENAEGANQSVSQPSAETIAPSGNEIPEVEITAAAPAGGGTTTTTTTTTTEAPAARKRSRTPLFSGPQPSGTTSPIMQPVAPQTAPLQASQPVQNAAAANNAPTQTAPTAQYGTLTEPNKPVDYTQPIAGAYAQAAPAAEGSQEDTPLPNPTMENGGGEPAPSNGEGTLYAEGPNGEKIPLDEGSKTETTSTTDNKGTTTTTTETTSPSASPVLGEDGKPLKDENGKPVMEQQVKGLDATPSDTAMPEADTNNLEAPNIVDAKGRDTGLKVEHDADGNPKIAETPDYQEKNTSNRIQDLLEELSASDKQLDDRQQELERRKHLWENITKALTSVADIYGASRGAKSIYSPQAYDTSKTDSELEARFKKLRADNKEQYERRLKQLETQKQDAYKRKEEARKDALAQAQISNYESLAKQREINSRIKSDESIAKMELNDLKKETEKANALYKEAQAEYTRLRGTAAESSAYSTLLRAQAYVDNVNNQIKNRDDRTAETVTHNRNTEAIQSSKNAQKSKGSNGNGVQLKSQIKKLEL